MVLLSNKVRPLPPLLRQKLLKTYLEKKLMYHRKFINTYIYLYMVLDLMTREKPLRSHTPNRNNVLKKRTWMYHVLRQKSLVVQLHLVATYILLSYQTSSQQKQGINDIGVVFFKLHPLDHLILYLMKMRLKMKEIYLMKMVVLD